LEQKFKSSAGVTLRLLASLISALATPYSNSEKADNAGSETPLAAGCGPPSPSPAHATLSSE